MAQKHVLEFHEAKAPITAPVSKFGGQPVWIGAPQWPLSRETGNPMRFICQIAIDPKLFPAAQAKMAYLFMTDEEDGEFVDGTYEPNGGENAVILQPGNYTKPTRELTTGPTLYQMVQLPGVSRLTPQACEFGVTLSEDEDPEFIGEEQRADRADDGEDGPELKLDENKIGGTPCFLQGDEFPFNKESPLLLQLDSGSVPFSINFGDMGVGYAFLNAAGDEARFLWQCG